MAIDKTLSNKQPPISPEILKSMREIVQDLSKPLTAKHRYARILQAWREAFPCDACALLQLEGYYLVPRAADGLNPSVMGRRFTIEDHPRLARILNQQGDYHSVRFDADSPLPDPYDGLIDTADAQLHVHDCMGAVLRVDGQAWGVVTMDALNPSAFDNINKAAFNTFIDLSAAAIKTAELITALTLQADHQQQVTAALIQEQQQHEMLGQSPLMMALKKDIKLVAQSDLTALIFGESGVGKELVARAIHQQSLRAERAIVTVNCAALPEALVESELFGHVVGAFSGASQNRVGKFELANKGTLFLDEVGELPLTVQSKLLRVLQYGELQRLGSDDQHQVDVRIIAATNRDLKAEVSAGRFRADLYHRLSVYPLHVPALRQRGNDLLLLAGYFLGRLQRQLGVNSLGLSTEAEVILLGYDWPGNVRELEHLLSRAALKAMARSGRAARAIILNGVDLDISANVAESTACAQEAGLSVQGGGAEHGSDLKAATDHFQRQHIQRQLDRQQGNLAATARQLGIDRSNFQRLIKRLGMRQ